MIVAVLNSIWFRVKVNQVTLKSKIFFYFKQGLNWDLLYVIIIYSFCILLTGLHLLLDMYHFVPGGGSLITHNSYPV